MCYMTGSPEGSTESISWEAVNRNLQGIVLIHYNMAASRHRLPETKFLFVAVFLGCTSTGRVSLWFCGSMSSSTGSGSGFKASQKTGQRLKVSSDRLGETSL